MGQCSGKNLGGTQVGLLLHTSLLVVPLLVLVLELAPTVLTRVLIVAGPTSRPRLSAREKLLLQPSAIIPRLPSLVWRAIADALLKVVLQLLFQACAFLCAGSGRAGSEHSAS